MSELAQDSENHELSNALEKLGQEAAWLQSSQVRLDRIAEHLSQPARVLMP